ncbi:hypothetical protein VQ643_04365 [Pseudomonas sp. F1_0610]|uniref:hypothetical protein n=1 Tax=Pseudomonas sp. F1_0610 TaxID=3114284 RepID=UPI0039C125DD
MAYIKSTANSIVAIQTLLVDACQEQGWIWDSVQNQLSKNTMQLQLNILADNLRIRAKHKNEGNYSAYVRTGYVNGKTNIVFPAEVHLFIFSQEVYLVIEYDVSHFQFLSFGISTLNSDYLWLGGTFPEASSQNNISVSMRASIGSNTAVSALFWAMGAQWGGGTSFIYDGSEWQWKGGQMPGFKVLEPILKIQPSAWNAESALIPIRGYKNHLENKIVLYVDLEHARHIRIDNYEPGAIVMLGSEKWKILPWFYKNIEDRDGVTALSTGTFGWAIRYDGP